MAHIEHHPENGIAPFVVIVPSADGGLLWIAYPTREIAEAKLPEIVRWSLLPGSIFKVDVDDTTMHLPSTP